MHRANFARETPSRWCLTQLEIALLADTARHTQYVARGSFGPVGAPSLRGHPRLDRSRAEIIVEHFYFSCEASFMFARVHMTLALNSIN